MGCLGSTLLFAGEKLPPQCGQQRRRLLPTQIETLGYGKTAGVLLDSIESAHHFDHYARDFGSGLFLLDDLSSHVRPTPGARDLVAGDHAIVPTVGVSQQNLPVVFRKYFGPSRPRCKVKRAASGLACWRR
jgi:hypothetical protein